MVLPDGVAGGVGTCPTRRGGGIERPSRWVRNGSGGSALRLALRILVIALAVYLLLPQLAGLEASGRALARARRWWLPPLVLGLEGASLLAYAELVRTVLVSTGQPVARRLIQRVTFAGYALGRTLPGGSMSALAVITTELRGLGFSAAPTAAALAASGLVSSAVLVLLFPFAALLALLGGEGGGVVLGAAGLAALLVLAVALAARPTLRRPEALGRLAERAAAAVARGPLRRHLDPAGAADARRGRPGRVRDDGRAGRRRRARRRRRRQRARMAAGQPLDPDRRRTRPAADAAPQPSARRGRAGGRGQAGPGLQELSDAAPAQRTAGGTRRPRGRHAGDRALLGAPRRRGARPARLQRRRAPHR